MIAQVEIYCGPMAVRHVKRGLSRTDNLDASGVVIGLPEGTVNFDISFPPTDVTIDRPIDPIHWTVAECKATTPTATNLVQAVSLLPPEPCVLHIKHEEGIWLWMLAMAIDAPTTITLADGRVGTGIVRYPDAWSKLVSPGVFLVPAVKATGDIDFGEQSC